MRVDPLLLMMACGCIAALLLHAALAKLSDRAEFAQHLAAYGVPAALQPALAWALPLTEALLALALVTPWRSAAALAAAALLASYGAVMAWHVLQGHVLDCGCGGEPLPVSAWLVARNAVLAALATVAAQPGSGRAVDAGDFAVAAAAVLLATLLYAAFNQLLRQRSAAQRSRGRAA